MNYIKTFALTFASKILIRTPHMETMPSMGLSDNNQVDVIEAFNYLHVLLNINLLTIQRHHRTVLLRTFWPAATFLYHA